VPHSVRSARCCDCTVVRADDGTVVCADDGTVVCADDGIVVCTDDVSLTVMSTLHGPGTRENPCHGATVDKSAEASGLGRVNLPFNFI